MSKEITKVFISGQMLQNRIARFQTKTFPGQTLDSKLEHLRREVGELKDNPTDQSEWADCLILLLGAAALSGLGVGDLVSVAHLKMDINEKRQWGKPDAQDVYHHIP